MKHTAFLGFLFVLMLLSRVYGTDDPSWGIGQQKALMKRDDARGRAGAGAGAGSGGFDPSIGKPPPKSGKSDKVDAFLAGGPVLETGGKKRSKKEIVAASDADFRDLVSQRLGRLRKLEISNYSTCAPSNPGFPDHNKNSYFMRGLELPALVSLVIRNCDFSEGFPLSNLSMLTNLSLTYCKTVPDGADLEKGSIGVCRKVLSSFNPANLQVLTLFWNGRVSDSLLGLISTSCVNLKELSFNEGSGVTDDAMVVMTQRLTQLTKLWAIGCRDITDDGLVHMGTLPLVDLQLSWNLGIKSIKNLLGCTGLTSLNLQGNEGLESISGIETLSSLESLDLSFCSKLRSPDGLSYMPKLSVNIKNSGLLAALPPKPGKIQYLRRELAGDLE